MILINRLHWAWLVEFLYGECILIEGSDEICPLVIETQNNSSNPNFAQYSWNMTPISNMAKTKTRSTIDSPMRMRSRARSKIMLMRQMVILQTNRTAPFLKIQDIIF